MLFPLLLARQAGQPGHCLVPIEVEGRLDYHEKRRPEYINLHFQNADRTDARPYLRPGFRPAVNPPVFRYQPRIVFQAERLAISLDRLIVFSDSISFFPNLTSFFSIANIALVPRKSIGNFHHLMGQYRHFTPTILKRQPRTTASYLATMRIRLRFASCRSRSLSMLFM